MITLEDEFLSRCALRLRSQLDHLSEGIRASIGVIRDRVKKRLDGVVFLYDYLLCFTIPLPQVSPRGGCTYFSWITYVYPTPRKTG